MHSTPVTPPSITYASTVITVLCYGLLCLAAALAESGRTKHGLFGTTTPIMSINGTAAVVIVAEEHCTEDHDVVNASTEPLDDDTLSISTLPFLHCPTSPVVIGHTEHATAYAPTPAGCEQLLCAATEMRTFKCGDAQSFAARYLIGATRCDAGEVCDATTYFTPHTAWTPTSPFPHQAFPTGSIVEWRDLRHVAVIVDVLWDAVADEALLYVAEEGVAQWEAANYSRVLAATRTAGQSWAIRTMNESDSDAPVGWSRYGYRVV